MDPQTAAVLVNYGVAGVLCVIILVWKRQDDLDRRDLEKAHREDLKQHIARLEARDSIQLQLMKDSTEAMKALQGGVGGIGDLLRFSNLLTRLEEQIDDTDAARGRRQR